MFVFPIPGLVRLWRKCIRRQLVFIIIYYHCSLDVFIIHILCTNNGWSIIGNISSFIRIEEFVIATGDTLLLFWSFNDPNGLSDHFFFISIHPISLAALWQLIVLSPTTLVYKKWKTEHNVQDGWLFFLVNQMPHNRIFLKVTKFSALIPENYFFWDQMTGLFVMFDNTTIGVSAIAITQYTN